VINFISFGVTTTIAFVFVACMSPSFSPSESVQFFFQKEPTNSARSRPIRKQEYEAKIKPRSSQDQAKIIPCVSKEGTKQKNDQLQSHLFKHGTSLHHRVDDDYHHRVATYPPDTRLGLAHSQSPLDAFDAMEL
jgi:hypothetical protein